MKRTTVNRALVLVGVLLALAMAFATLRGVETSRDKSKDVLDRCLFAASDQAAKDACWSRYYATP